MWSGAGRSRARRPSVHCGRVRIARWFLAVGGVVSLLTACGTDPGVATQSAERLVTPTPTTAVPLHDRGGTAGHRRRAGDDRRGAAEHRRRRRRPDRARPRPFPAAASAIASTWATPRSARDYDEFVRLALNDIERWWAGEFPAIYGQPFEPLAGGVYAAYPERTTPIPGCETDTPTEYPEIAQYSAFYCMDGDFMVYDDGPNGVLAGLAGEFGPSILGVVFAHEFGHADPGPRRRARSQPGHDRQRAAGRLLRRRLGRPRPRRRGRRASRSPTRTCAAASSR